MEASVLGLPSRTALPLPYASAGLPVCGLASDASLSTQAETPRSDPDKANECDLGSDDAMPMDVQIRCQPPGSVMRTLEADKQPGKSPSIDTSASTVDSGSAAEAEGEVQLQRSLYQSDRRAPVDGDVERLSPVDGDVERLSRQLFASDPTKPVAVAPRRVGTRMVRRPTLKLDLSGLAPSSVAAAGEQIPDVLEASGYDRQELIGSGSYAKVYKAKRRSDGRIFVAKHIHSEDEEVKKSAKAEYEIMAGLDHAAIVRVEGLYTGGRHMWFCMELCTDGTLQRHVECHGATSDVRGRGLLSQLVEGVDYLHQKRIVHRDLKPENLFLHDEATVLKIGDFNCAKQLGSGTSTTAMLTHRGTPLYAAPEIRFSLQWNERVDVWAIGLTAYFMMRTTLPFNAEKPAVVTALREGNVPEICWDGVCDNGKNLILQCLEVDMRMRPAPMELKLHPYFHEDAPAKQDVVWTRNRSY